MAKAKNVYQTISELSQLKAGRQRTLVDHTCHMKAKKTIYKSETDFKVKAGLWDGVKMLLSKKARREFIEKNALTVSNLDV